MSSQRIRCFKQHPTHSTHVQDVIAGTSSTHVTGSGRVSSTSGTGLPQQPDVAVLAPGRPPAVPHQPEVGPILAAVANQLDSVVQCDVVLVITSWSRLIGWEDNLDLTIQSHHELRSNL